MTYNVFGGTLSITQSIAYYFFGQSDLWAYRLKNYTAFEKNSKTLQRYSLHTAVACSQRGHCHCVQRSQP